VTVHLGPESVHLKEIRGTQDTPGSRRPWATTNDLARVALSKYPARSSVTRYSAELCAPDRSCSSEPISAGGVSGPPGPELCGTADPTHDY
jgi:hypothetical protein